MAVRGGSEPLRPSEAERPKEADRPSEADRAKDPPKPRDPDIVGRASEGRTDDKPRFGVEAGGLYTVADRDIATVGTEAAVLVLVLGTPLALIVTIRLATKISVSATGEPVPAGPRLLMKIQTPLVCVTARQPDRAEHLTEQARKLASPGTRFSSSRDRSSTRRPVDAGVCEIAVAKGKV